MIFIKLTLDKFSKTRDHFFVLFLSAATPYWVIALGLALMGLGGGLFWSPNTSAAMSASPKKRLGVASATLATLKTNRNGNELRTFTGRRSRKSAKTDCFSDLYRDKYYVRLGCNAGFCHRNS
jgi:hypothetical protein